MVPACDFATLGQGVDLDKVVAAELAKKSGAEVTVGSASLSWTGALQVESIDFAPGKDGSRIHVPKLTWGLDLGRSWNAMGSLATLTVEQPVIRVQRGSEKLDGGDLLVKLMDPENASMRPGQVDVSSARVILEGYGDGPQEVTGITLGADLSVPDQATFQVTGTAPGGIPFDLRGHHDRATRRTELAVNVDQVPVGPLTLDKLQAAFSVSPKEVTLTSLSAASIAPAGLPLQAGPGTISRNEKKKRWSWDALPAKLGDVAVELSGHWISDLDHALRVDPVGKELVALGAARPGSVRVDLDYTRTKKERKLSGDVKLAGLDLPLTVKGHAIPAKLETATFRFKGATVKSQDAAFQVGELKLAPGIQVTDLFEKPQVAVDLPRTEIDLAQLTPYLDAKAAQVLADLKAQGKLAVRGKLTGPTKDPDFQGSLQIVGLELDAPAAGGVLKITGGELTHGDDGWTLADGKLEREGTTWALSARATPTDGGMRVAGEATAANQSLRDVLGPERGAKLDPASTAKVDVHLGFVAEGEKLERTLAVSPRGGKFRVGTSGSWVPLGKGGRVTVEGETFTLDDVALELGGRSVTLSGKATPASEGYSLTGLQVEIGGQTLSGGGRLEVSPVRVDLDLASKRFDPSALASGGKLSLDGAMPLALKIRGAPGDLAIDGQLSLSGARVKGAGHGSNVEVTSGTLRFTGKRAVLEGVRVSMGGAGFTVSGAIDDPLGAGRYDDVRLAGTVPFALLAPGKGISGSGHLETTVSGSVSSPKVNGRLTAEEIVTSGRTLRDLSARVDTNKRGIVLEDLKASVGGYRVTGSLTFPKEGAPQHDVEIHGLSFASLGAGRGGVVEGSFALSLSGSGLGDSMRSKGTLTSHDMVVHGQKIPQIAGARGKVRAGAIGAQLIGALLSDKNLGDLARAGGQQVEYYGQLVDQLSASHSMGPVRARVRVDPGKIVLDPIEGRRVIGRLTVDRGSNRLSGRLDKLNLSGVEISNVKIGGTTGKPDFDVDLDNVAMAGGGRRSRRSSREGMGSILEDGMRGGGGSGEEILQQVLGGSSRRNSRRARGGDILGDIPGGGGGRSRGEDLGGAILQQLFR